MKAFFMKLLKDKATKKAGESLNENGFSLSPLFKYAIFGSGGFVFFLLVIVVIVVLLFPVLLAQEYFGSDNNKVFAYDYCGSSCGENELKFYSKLGEVVDSYKSKGVDIDANLISGTVFYGSTLSSESFDPDDDTDSNKLIEDSKIHISDVGILASNIVAGNSLDYDKYRSYLVNVYIPNRFGDLYTDEKGIEKIADEIMSYASYDGDSSLVSNNCSFNQQEQQQIDVDSNYINNIMVNVLLPYYHNFNTEKSTESDVEYVVSLKEYVTGVVYREIHAGINKMSDETIKANLVAIKSFTIDRHPSVQNGDKYYISMRNNTDDQVYCNLDEGCNHYSKFGEGNLLGPATADVKDLLYRLYDETNDDFLYNTSQKKFIGEYRDSKATCLKAYTPANCMSQLDSISMGNEGNDYKAILMAFYTDNVGLLNISNSTVSTGAYACSKTSYMGGGKYSSNAPRYDNSSDFFANINYNYFKPTTYPWYGECPWYAGGRAIEIMAYSNMPDDLKNKRMDFLRNMTGNGEAWYRNPSDELFSKSTDLYAVKPGSIVSWSGGGAKCPESPMGLCGHVGIIEDVEYDSSGRAIRVLLSDGWNDRSRGYKVASYAFRWMDMESLRRYSTRTTYYFNGYVYLLD